MNVIVNWHVGWHSKPKMTAHKHLSFTDKIKVQPFCQPINLVKLFFKLLSDIFFFLIKVKAGSCYKYQYTGKNGADKS